MHTHEKGTGQAVAPYRKMSGQNSLNWISEELYRAMDRDFSGRTVFLFPDSFVMKARWETVANRISKILHPFSDVHPTPVTEYYQISKDSFGRIKAVAIPSGKTAFRIDQEGFLHEGSVPLFFISHFLQKEKLRKSR